VCLWIRTPKINVFRLLLPLVWVYRVQNIKCYGRNKKQICPPPSSLSKEAEFVAPPSFFLLFRRKQIRLFKKKWEHQKITTLAEADMAPNKSQLSASLGDAFLTKKSRILPFSAPQKGVGRAPPFSTAKRSFFCGKWHSSSSVLFGRQCWPIGPFGAGRQLWPIVTYLVASADLSRRVWFSLFNLGDKCDFRKNHIGLPKSVFA